MHFWCANQQLLLVLLPHNESIYSFGLLVFTLIEFINENDKKI